MAWEEMEDVGALREHTMGCYLVQAHQEKTIEYRWSREAVERIEATPWRLIPSPKDGSGGPRLLLPLPDDQLIRYGQNPR